MSRSIPSYHTRSRRKLPISESTALEVEAQRNDRSTSIHSSNKSDTTAPFVPAHRQNYATFRPVNATPRKESNPLASWWSEVVEYLFLCNGGGPSVTHKQQSSWKVVLASSLLVCLLVFRVRREYYPIPRWGWDHNVYLPRSSNASKTTTAHERIALVAQMGGNPNSQVLAEITSRPNRAYARQWHMDYLQYSSGKPFTCLDKVFLLHHILESQRKTPKYDAMLVLPPDSVIMDLDSNVLQLLPPNKLVAIAGWDPHKLTIGMSRTDIVMFNLQHPYSTAVLEYWWDSVQGLTCGAGNDLGLLINAIASVVSQQEPDDWDHVIQPLEESPDGYILPQNVIKCIPPSVPGSRDLMLTTNLAEKRTILQTTVDSVCYRYYPRCEVL